MSDALRSLFTNVTGSFHPLSDTGPDSRAASPGVRACASAPPLLLAQCGRARALTLGSKRTDEELIMGKGVHPTSKVNERRGFQCLGHSNWTICSLLSPFCPDNFPPFSLSYWGANSYYPRGPIMGRVDLLIQNWFYKKSKGRQCKGRRPRNFDFFS